MAGKSHSKELRCGCFKCMMSIAKKGWRHFNASVLPLCSAKDPLRGSWPSLCFNDQGESRALRAKTPSESTLGKAASRHNPAWAVCMAGVWRSAFLQCACGLFTFSFHRQGQSAAEMLKRPRAINEPASLALCSASSAPGAPCACSPAEQKSPDYAKPQTSRSGSGLEPCS